MRGTWACRSFLFTSESTTSLAGWQVFQRTILSRKDALVAVQRSLFTESRLSGQFTVAMNNRVKSRLGNAHGSNTPGLPQPYKHHLWRVSSQTCPLEQSPRIRPRCLQQPQMHPQRWRELALLPPRRKVKFFCLPTLLCAIDTPPTSVRFQSK